MKILLFFLLSFFTVINVYSNQDNLKILARVGDEIVFNEDVKDRVGLFKVLQKDDYKKNFLNQEESFSKEMLNLLINEILLEQEAKKMNINIDEKEVVDYLLYSQNFENEEQIKNFAQDNNLDWQIWARSIRFNILKEKFLMQLIFYSQDSLSDENIMELLNLDDILHIKKIILSDNRDLNWREQSCAQLQEGEDLFLKNADLDESIYEHFVIKKQKFLIDKKENTVLLWCNQESVAENFIDDEAREKLHRRRILLGMHEYFEKLRMKYVIFFDD